MRVRSMSVPADAYHCGISQTLRQKQADRRCHWMWPSAYPAAGQLPLPVFTVLAAKGSVSALYLRSWLSSCLADFALRKFSLTCEILGCEGVLWELSMFKMGLA